MELLALLFVANPQNILAVAFAILVVYSIIKFGGKGTTRQQNSLLVMAIAWGLYAAWEGLVLIKTPEANIRVDLLIIWPLLAMFSAFMLYRMFR